jgi:tryptophan-rich sensory protein
MQSVGIGVLILIVLYFMPTLIAFSKDKSNKVAIMALNFFLGWTFIFWVISLVWSLTNNDSRA